MPFRVKRIYEAPSPRDGLRVLVDRLWPRGISKEAARLDLWLREISPSDALRKEFAHDHSRWKAFKSAYFRELGEQPDAVAQLRREGRGRVVTLLYAARDEVHNNAVALLEYLTGDR
jgi:uncharacterized protein YeaO (DUF488 family)